MAETEQLRVAVEALERIADPTYLPRTEEAILLQGQHIAIAQAALDRLTKDSQEGR